MKIYSCKYKNLECEVQAPNARVARWCAKNIFEQSWTVYFTKKGMKSIEVKRTW